MIRDGAIELALRTWYPKDHPLHNRAHHPLGKLVGEWGEALEDYMKMLYKPDYKYKFADELGDIWYYLRILCYQRDYQPVTFDIYNNNYYDGYDLLPDEIIAMAIDEANRALLSLLRHNYYSLFALDVSYTCLLELLERKHLTLDELTKLNWQKLKPGSERGEQWMKARDGA
jgi:hypothetical protein